MESINFAIRPSQRDLELQLSLTCLAPVRPVAWQVDTPLLRDVTVLGTPKVVCPLIRVASIGTKLARRITWFATLAPISKPPIYVNGARRTRTGVPLPLVPL
jgi:hypothetical protein